MHTHFYAFTKPVWIPAFAGMTSYSQLIIKRFVVVKIKKKKLKLADKPGFVAHCCA